jgi:hypothetical protein
MPDPIRKTDERVRERAYLLWERAGRPHGRNEVYWGQALREIQHEDVSPDAPLQDDPVDLSIRDL